MPRAKSGELVRRIIVYRIGIYVQTVAGESYELEAKDLFGVRGAHILHNPRHELRPSVYRNERTEERDGHGGADSYVGGTIASHA
jgi:hypothetical protein